MDLTVDGTLTFQTGGNGGKLAMKPGTGNTANITVNNGGTINLGQDFLQDGLGTTNITVNSGGAINNLASGRSITLSGAGTSVVVNGTGTFTTGANTISMGASNISGTGAFTLSSGGTISVSNSSGLEQVAGPIRTTTRNFNSGANYSYVGAAAQATGSDLPGTVNDLSLAGVAGTTVTNPVVVNGTLTLGGDNNYVNLNTVTGYAGLTYEATVAQTTGAELGASITNLSINNSNGVALGGSTNVTGTLTMQAGNLALNANTLTLGTSVGSPGTLTYTAGYLTGTGTFTRWIGLAAISGTAGTFPMGVGTNNRTVEIGGTPSAGGTVSVSYNDASTVSPITFTETQFFVNRYDANWVVAQSGITCGAISLAIHGDGIPGITAIADLTVSGATTAALGTPAATTGTTAAPVVNRAGFTQATLPSTYYFASTSTSPLPVEMTSFTATMQSANNAVLRWNTATEVNNQGFEVERRAEESSAWAKVGFVSGAGTSNSPKAYSFIDRALASGRYTYRLKQIDNGGSFKYYGTEASVEVAAVPKILKLEANYPNPFNPTTNISFTVPSEGRAVVKIFTVLGKEVATLFNDVAVSGKHYSVPFNAASLSSGIYFSQLEFAGERLTKKMLMVK
jgi:hypothetical protein